MANHSVRTTQKTFDIVEALADRDAAGITELADELDMSKSIVHNHVSTLQDRGYVVRDGEEYRLSYKFLDIGGRRRQQLGIYQNGRPEIKKLASETGELVNLGVEERGKCIYLFQARGSEAVKLELNHTGAAENLHSTAIGKAILAHLPDERIETIVDQHGLPKRTEKTVTKYDALLDELEEIRERGFATDDEESIPGLRCVAAPIKTTDMNVLGAVSVSGPISRIKDRRWEDELPDLVQDTANVIAINSQYGRS